MEIIELNELKNKVSSFTSAHCDYLSESCIVALETGSHTDGCTMSVTGDTDLTVQLKWPELEKRRGYRERTKYIEHGAEAIAFFLSFRLTEFEVVEEAAKGTGIDYWLGYKEQHKLYDPVNFMNARLEVSGIEKENSGNSLERRVKIKKRQSDKTDFTRLPAYISVTEFSHPKTYFGKK